MRRHDAAHGGNKSFFEITICFAQEDAYFVVSFCAWSSKVFLSIIPVELFNIKLTSFTFMPVKSVSGHVREKSKGW